eukprot:11175451-Lingulodinium_polyedra.AAC.1
MAATRRSRTKRPRSAARPFSTARISARLSPMVSSTRPRSSGRRAALCRDTSATNASLLWMGTSKRQRPATTKRQRP